MVLDHIQSDYICVEIKKKNKFFDINKNVFIWFASHSLSTGN